MDKQKILHEMLNDIMRALDSKEYMAIIKENNTKWGSVKDKGFYYLPAGGIDYEALLKHIRAYLSNRFGMDLAFLNKNGEILDVAPLPVLTLRLTPEDGIPYASYFEYDTYLPTEVDILICEWVKNTDDNLTTFVKKICDQFETFKLPYETQIGYVYLDVFYSALEKRLKELPYAKKIDEDFSNSIYMNPDFIFHELENIFPIIKFDNWKNKDNYENGDTIASLRVINDITDDEHTNKADQYIGPHHKKYGVLWNAMKKYEFIFNDLDKEKNVHDALYDSLATFLRVPYPYKLLKCCYPLYIFLCINILIEYFIFNHEKPFLCKGCKIITRDYWNLDSIRDMFAYKMKPLTNMKINVHRKKHTFFHLYALACYFRYIYLNDGFHCSYKYKITKSNEFKKNRIYIKYDMIFTNWLFVKYSTLFHISLMKNIENADTENIVLPRHFFTAFNFEKNIFIHYPELHKQYNDFIEASSNELLEKYKKYSIEEWLSIAEHIPGSEISFGDKKASICFSGIHRIEQILYNFYSLSLDDKTTFERYYKIYETVKNNTRNRYNKR